MLYTFLLVSPPLPQRKLLLHLSVPSLFIAVALDEGPGPPLRSPYADLSKLYAVVGILVRSCDVSIMQKSLYEVKSYIVDYLVSRCLSYSEVPLMLSVVVLMTVCHMFIVAADRSTYT